MNNVQARIESIFRFLLHLLLAAVVLAMYPGTIDPTGDTKWLLVSWGATLLSLGWIVYAWRYDVAFRLPRLLGPVLLVFLSLYLVATVASEFVNFGVLATSKFFNLAALYFLAAQLYHNTRNLRRLMFTVCFAVALASCYGMLQKIGWDPFPWQDRGSDIYAGLPATFGHPNFAAHTLILVIIMAVFLLWEGIPRLKQSPAADENQPAPPNPIMLGGIGISLLLFLLHLYLTGQRAGWIALAAAGFLVVVAAVLGRRFRSATLGAVVCLTLLGVSGIAAVAGATLLSKAATGNALPLDQSILIRYQSYVSGANMLMDKPLIGHGPGAYAIAYPKYWTKTEQQWFAEQRKMNEHVHNDLMEIGIDAGLPAAGAYLTLLVLGMGYSLVIAFLPGARRRRLMGYAFAAMFCAFLVDGLFGFNLRVPVSATLLFVFAGAMEGLWIPATRPAAPGNRRFLTQPWRVGVAFLLPFCLLLETRSFLGQCAQFEGISLYTKGDYPAARAAFRRGERMAPWHWEFARRLGLTAVAMGKPKEAVLPLQRAINNNPYYTLSLLAQAHAKMTIGQQHLEQNPGAEDETLYILEEAAKHARESLVISPLDSGGADLLGRIASISAIAASRSADPALAAKAPEYWKTAEEQMSLAIDLGAENSEDLYRMLFKVKGTLGDVPGAEEALSHAVTRGPDRPELWADFLAFAREHKRYDRLRNTLVAQMNRLGRLEKPDPEAVASTQIGLAQVRAEGYQDFEGADKAFLEAVRLAPGRADMWAALGDYVLANQRFALLDQALASDSGALAVAALPQVAIAADALKNPPEFLNAAGTRLLALFQSNSDLSTSKAQYGWVAGLLNSRLEAAGASAGPLCTAAYSLGVVANRMGEQERAARLLEAANPCATAEERPLLAVHWGDALIALEQRTRAIEVLRAAAQEFPQNFDVRWAFARGLARIDLKNEAKAEYERLIGEPFLDPRGKAILQEEMEKL